MLAELFFISFENTEIAKYHYIELDLQVNPSKQVSEFCLDRNIQSIFIHSTSWRFEIGKGLILTFLAITNKESFDSCDYKTVDIVAKKYIHDIDQHKSLFTTTEVLRHAIAHLALLYKSDSTSPVFKNITNKYIELLLKIEPVAGGSYM